MSDPLVDIDVSTLPSGAAHVAVAGEIDMANAEAVERRLDEALHGLATAVIDLGSVEYIDSRGVRMLCDLADRARWHDVLVAVAAPPDGVAGEVLAVAGLTEALSA